MYRTCFVCYLFWAPKFCHTTGLSPLLSIRWRSLIYSEWAHVTGLDSRNVHVMVTRVIKGGIVGFGNVVFRKICNVLYLSVYIAPISLTL